MKRFILVHKKIIDTQNYYIKQEKCLNGLIHFFRKHINDIIPFYDYATITPSDCFSIRPFEIIEEADNLVDLLEVGDKVDIKEKNKIQTYYIERLGNREEIDENTIMKIQKPNKIFGDYDLAWEHD